MPINRADRDDIVSGNHARNPAVGHQAANNLEPIGKDEVATYLCRFGDHFPQWRII
jgi:hypothetical protein